ncbi:hypothetical protein HRbin19_00453 [bacterium HR19]|nr:hypothetical protein HRbin19_00453 [bacterium HR19]
MKGDEIMKHITKIVIVFLLGIPAYVWSKKIVICESDFDCDTGQYCVKSPYDDYGVCVGGCSSDFDCGIGYYCVKPPYKSYGTCMKVVDEYNIPKPVLPRPESIYPRYEGDCESDFDCPIGFRCDRKYKACIKIKRW